MNCVQGTRTWYKPGGNFRENQWEHTHCPYQNLFLCMQFTLFGICFLLVLICLTLWPWRLRQYIPSKHWWTCTGLHSIASKKMVLVIVTAVKTCNLTYLLWVIKKFANSGINKRQSLHFIQMLLRWSIQGGSDWWDI
jgi:hypothetical protein